MATEWIDIVDTTVKIGLGALISGLTTYYVTVTKNDHEKEKESKLLQRDLIIQATNYADEYFDYTYHYYSLLSGVVEARNEFEFEKEDWEEAQKSILQVEKEISDARKNIYAAQSKLELLGLREPAQYLASFKSGSEELRKYYTLNEKNAPTSDFLQNWANKYIPIKNEFRNSLSTIFMNLI